MAKSVTADSWNEVVGRDETGSLVQITYTCPYCDSLNSEMKLIVPSNFDKLDNGFEIDLKCDDCGKPVTVRCI